MKVRMRYKKDTKNTYVYEEVSSQGNELEDFEKIVPVLYIRKQAFGRTPPQELYVQFTTREANLDDLASA